MPFVALNGSARVSPIDVPADAIVVCPKCQGEMKVKTRYYNRGKLISRHFYHVDDVDCGGESDVHHRMKTQAVSSLREVFPNAKIESEHQIGDRIADVVTIFPRPVSPYGNGIVVEVQHKNADKPIAAVTDEYLDAGYSVYWAYLSDFEGSADVDSAGAVGQMAIHEHRLRTVWPDAVPDPPGYSPVIEQLWAGEFGSAPPERRIRIPGPFWTAHRFAFQTPMQAATAGVPPGGWTLQADVSLHSYGSRTCWVNVFGGPDDVPYLAIWEKDYDEERTSHLILPLRRRDRQSLANFVEDLQEVTDEDGTLASLSKPLFRAVRGFDTDPLSGWVALYPTSEDEAWFEFGSSDPAGNERTIPIEYRAGDVDRLEDVISAAGQV